MLPPFIIEQIRKREEQEKRDRRREQPRLELPLRHHGHPDGGDEKKEQDDEAGKRGVIILDLDVGS